VRAPAKVNLYLGVGRRRPDGYHELATVYQAISLYDEVTARRGTEIRVHVTGRDAHLVPTGTRNLAYQAVAALAERTGLSAGIHLHVAKKIPVAAGLAGGSADAAAALVAADALWETGLSRAALTELAADLGSDVPFCVLGGTAVGIGRGEQLSPALVRGQFHWVLALAEGGLSTPAVYAEHDRVTRAAAPPPDVPTRLLAGLRAGDTAAVAHALHNDLQAAACSLMPDLARVLDAGRAAGALGGLVSGSGPTVAFLVADAQAGQELGAALLASGVCRRVEQAVGPVPGARVVAR
jgi:4-diphosphocytidyl-2-C-methyl-D-erythritol kinase